MLKPHLFGLNCFAIVGLDFGSMTTLWLMPKSMYGLSDFAITASYSPLSITFNVNIALTCILSITVSEESGLFKLAVDSPFIL